MIVLGIIAEYNPFHNGHLYLLQKAKEITGTEYSIAVLGGNFLQRGEPASWDKWIRTKMALQAGIDLVIELPFVFASQDAHSFAQAGVKILDSLGVVDYITFGCENNNIETLSRLANLIRKDPPSIKKSMREELKKGGNFPKIREQAIISFYRRGNYETNGISLNEISDTLKQSNNILALEYLIVLQSLKSNLKVLPIKRVGSSFLQENIEGKYSSATAIRKLASKYYQDPNEEQMLKELKTSLPLSTYQIIIDRFEQTINTITLSNYEQAILTRLRTIPLNNLRTINGIEEGLENKIKKAAHSSGNIEELINGVKSKRYTRTRIQRILIHSLFGLTKKETKEFNKIGPLYCRILGLNKKGKLILKKAKSLSKLPIINNFNNFYQQCKRLDDKTTTNMLDYDILASDLYVLAYNKNDLRIGGADFTTNLNIF